MNYQGGVKPPYLYYSNNAYNNYNKFNNSLYFAQQQVPVNQETGFIELFVFTERGQIPVKDAIVTIYARQTTFVGLPIQTIITTTNPVAIELPVAHPSGALIQGPEYYFTTYNITITADGYSPVTVLNIRIFPGITENLDINLYEVAPGTFPIPEKIIDIPPHPRDALIY